MPLTAAIAEDKPKVTGHSAFTAPASPPHPHPPHALPGAATVSANRGAAASSKHSEGSLVQPSPKEHHASHTPGNRRHVASAHTALEVTSQTIAHESKEATKALAGAERRLKKARSAAKKADQNYENSRKAEQSAKKLRAAALKVMRAAKGRRAADYRRAKAGSGGSPLNLKKADTAIRKAEWRLDNAGARWMRAKEAGPIQAQAVREAAAVVKGAEEAMGEATDSVEMVEEAMRKQKLDNEQAHQEWLRLKEEHAKLQEEKVEKKAAMKKARRDRIGKTTEGATAKEIQLMKAYESRLDESMHAIAGKAKASRDEVQAHKHRRKAKPWAERRHSVTHK